MNGEDLSTIPPVPPNNPGGELIKKLIFAGIAVGVLLLLKYLEG